MKIVINDCYGGYGLSEKAIERVKTLKKGRDKLIPESTFNSDCFDRDDVELVEVVEELGKEANTEYSLLKIVEIPDGIEWEISEYDGLEMVEEKHRRWG